MSDTTFVPGIAAPPIPIREVLPWAIFAALALLAIYFVGAEEGATFGMQLIMWATIGLVFGALTERALSAHGSRIANSRRQKLGTAA